MKETFSSEKEKIACNAMEVAYASSPLPVIPVRDTGIQPLIVNKQVYRFDSHKNGRFHAKNNVHYEKTGFQCRSTGMTRLCCIAQKYYTFLSFQRLFFLSSQCVTLGSTLFSSWTLYAHRICSSLHNLQIFLYLDPSVTHWDDRRKATQMTPLLHSKFNIRTAVCLTLGMTPFIFPNHNVCTVISGITSGRLGEL